MNDSYIINQNENSAEILLYGFIGNWKDTDSSRFISDFKKLESQHNKINVRLNSAGGDVFEGITIYNTLKNSPAEIHIYIDGLAASMASVIALAGSKIFMSRFAQLMIHRVSGSANGDADKLRETATLMDELEKSLLSIYSERTGTAEEKIQAAWMQRGKDTWFNASDAVKQKLVDEIFDGVIKKSPKKKENVREVWQFYNIQIENSLNNNDMQILNQFRSLYGLPESATEQDVLAAFQTQQKSTHELKEENEKLKQQNTEFQNQLQQSQKQKVHDLVEGAIKAMLITEDERVTYVALAESNYEATKTALSKRTPYRSITSQLQTTSVDAPEYKTFRDFQEKDPQLLAEMKEKEPVKYQALYKKEFGKNSKTVSL